MTLKPIYLGNTIKHSGTGNVGGGFVDIDNEKYYKISNYHEMPDFFLTVVSDSDHWMFLSSNGALTAGRKDRNNALFPYDTVDKIHDSRDITGSKTVVLVTADNKTSLWEPFTRESSRIYSIQRNIYKNIWCNKVIFEEINLDLGIRFQYAWNTSETYGFIKKSVIQNLHGKPVHIDLLDGIQNILPAGVDHDFQSAFSCLLDAYKKSELIRETKLGLFLLSSIPVDKAEPSESLRASTVWVVGLDSSIKILLSGRQLENFRNGLPVEEETDIRGKRGAYFVNTSCYLAGHEQKSWMMVAEINKDSTGVHKLNQTLRRHAGDMGKRVNEDIENGSTRLRNIVAKADGLQMGRDALWYARHFSNTLFNVMRGGVFQQNYMISTRDLETFAYQFNKQACNAHRRWFEKLPGEIDHKVLIELAEHTQNKDIIRICYEYLPLFFSRRHGDPSRPWNQFSIQTKNEDGTDKLNFEGNWRDIFQNWEALGLSYPGFLGSFISKFVNASTADGYNPYRITREGIDWESPDPGDQWSYIGYWGDHQIIYLQKFLELAKAFSPELLEQLLQKEIFVYANVPYRIKPYAEQIIHPQETIVFDFALNDSIYEGVRNYGADGKLLRGSDGEIYYVNLTEKILVSILTKLCNFIPEAGIWLNTQRPEWNDANNALVGNGASMVTLCYLRRAVRFWIKQFNELNIRTIPVSKEVEELFHGVYQVFRDNSDSLQSGFGPGGRKRMADQLGEAATAYRKVIYQQSFSGSRNNLAVSTLLSFSQTILSYLDHTIRFNKREDGLFHAYNLISFSAEEISIRPLYEMLEGQVAVLSAGILNPEEVLDVLDNLEVSRLFRQDQQSYLLYPDRELARFTDKNCIPEERVLASPLLSQLIQHKDTSVVIKDASGKYHFHWRFRNAAVLKKALENLPGEYSTLVQRDTENVLAIYEEVFDHHSFTGRSGTFFAYEGLGSIYWHMVSKLLLATQECYFRAVEEGTSPEITEKLKHHYYKIQQGLGLYKSPVQYGAFPTDAYSHTPAGAGVQQPGMTGQVKEDMLCRMFELGIHMKNGNLVFRFNLLNNNDFLDTDSHFEYVDTRGEKVIQQLQAGQLGFTYCQVPFIYHLSDEDKTALTLKNGQTIHYTGHRIDKEFASKIVNRSGEVFRADLFISSRMFMNPD